MEAQRLMAQMDEVRTGAQRLEEEAVRREGEASLLRNDMFHNQESIARIQGELEQSEAGGSAILEDIARREEEMEQKRQAIGQAEQEQLRLSEELESLMRSQDEFSGQMEALSNEAADLAMKLSDVRVQSVTSESSLSEITLRLSQLTAGITLRTQQSEAADRELEACKEDLRILTERVEELLNAAKGYEYRYNSRASKAEAAKENADKLGLDVEEKVRRVRLLEEMERNLEGFAQSVKQVMKQADRGALRGIHGPVSRLIHAEPAYALAVEKLPKFAQREVAAPPAEH